MTMDKTWLYHYDPETKQQSMEWQHSYVRTKASALKSFFYQFFQLFIYRCLKYKKILFYWYRISECHITRTIKYFIFGNDRLKKRNSNMWMFTLCPLSGSQITYTTFWSLTLCPSSCKKQGGTGNAHSFRLT